MRHKQLKSLAILCLLFLAPVNGCALLALGAAGVAGGYAVSNDGMEGISDKSYEHLWQVAHDVLERQGTIETADKERGKIVARVGGDQVKFKIEQATPHSVIVRVQARRFQKLFPDMDLARRIYTMIIKETR